MPLTRYLLSGVSIWLLFVATVSAGTKSTAVLRLSEAVETGLNYEVFGAPMPDKTVGLSLTELIAQKQDYLGKEVRVSATITQVCQAKGCFFIAMQDGNWARITFRDYAFFVPTNTANSMEKILMNCGFHREKQHFHGNTNSLHGVQFLVTSDDLMDSSGRETVHLAKSR